MKYKLNFSTSDYYRRLQTSVLLLFISLLGFVFLPYVVLDANATDTVNLETQWGKITLELQTGDGGDGSVNFNGGAAITPDATGVVATVAKTLTVNTTGKHFRVYLSMDGTMANQKLCYGFDAADDAKKNCTHTTIGIEPVGTGTPTALTGNTWGYALNDGEAGFSPAGTYYNSDISGNIITATAGKEEDAALYSAKFAAVPVSTAPVKIWSADTNNNNGFGTNSGITGDANNTKEIVYGVKVNSELVAGTYGSKILYTAMASASDFDTPSMNVASSKDLGGPTDVTTLYMDLNTEGISLSANNLTIRLVSHANAKIADGGASGDGKFTASELATAVASAAGTCASVSNLVVTTGGIKVDCTLPDLGAAADGVDYDFIVSVPVVAGGSDALTTNYVSYKKTGTDTGAFRYVGLQTKNGSNPYVTTMQGMTTGICKMTNQWGTGTGANAQLYDRYGEDGLAGDGTDAVAVGTAGVGTGSAYGNAIGKGTFALTDTRDSKQYLVRRLADGNCWMVQNLDLELGLVGTDSTHTTLTASNTDISYGLDTDDESYRASWDPSASYKSNSYGTFSTFSDWSDSVVGMSQPSQFQAWNELGNKGTSGNTVDYSWGSAKAADGTTLATGENVHDSVYVANNQRSQIPRSYSNTVSGQYRYIPTNSLTGARSGYSPQTTGSASDNPLPMTTGLMSTTVANSGNAQGYYGNMYVGNYYNWYAATAESGVYNSTSILTVEGSAKDSICPKGWQLPINGPDIAADSTNYTDKSWLNLIKGSYGLITKTGDQSVSGANPFNSSTEPSNRLQEVPLSIILSGYYLWVSGNPGNRGGGGSYWASTPSAVNSARYLYFYSTYVTPQNGNLKVYGFAVRCVAR